MYYNKLKHIFENNESTFEYLKKKIFNEKTLEMQN